MIDVLRLGLSKTLRDFDDVYTAPMHGYKNALDYWTQSSSKPLLPNIAVPTLILNTKTTPLSLRNLYRGHRTALMPCYCINQSREDMWASPQAPFPAPFTGYPPV